METETETEMGRGGDRLMAPWDSWDVPRLLLIALTVGTAVVFVVAASTSGAAFSVFNPSWDGASGLQTQADAVGVDADVVRSTDAYPQATPNETVAVILTPDRPYEPESAARVERFVRRGGTLVVGEDFGNHSNPLLAEIGADARVDGRLLRDERNTYRSPAMPVATNVSDHPLTEGVDALTLNYGTVVEPNGATVLVNSSGYGYLDDNENANLDENESLGQYPVATVESVGEGRVVVVSDASFTINAMLERSGNVAFVRSLLSGHETALLDFSHAETLPPLALALVVLRQTPVVQLVFGVAVVGALAVIVNRPGLRSAVRDRLRRTSGGHSGRSRSVVDDDELVAYLAQRHPDWDRERLERVVDSIRDRRD